MGKWIEKLDFIMSGVIRVAYYRSLHIVSVPFGSSEVVGYIQEQVAGEGQFGGSLETIRNGRLFGVWRWNRVRVGEGVVMDVWVYGFHDGAQTVLTRRGFWMLNFGQRSLGVLGSAAS